MKFSKSLEELNNAYINKKWLLKNYQTDDNQIDFIKDRTKIESRINICYSGSKLLGNDQHNLGSNGKRYLQVKAKANSREREIMRERKGREI